MKKGTVGLLGHAFRPGPDDLGSSRLLPATHTLHLTVSYCRYYPQPQMLSPPPK